MPLKVRNDPDGNCQRCFLFLSCDIKQVQARDSFFVGSKGYGAPVWCKLGLVDIPVRVRGNIGGLSRSQIYVREATDIRIMISYDVYPFSVFAELRII